MRRKTWYKRTTFYITLWAMTLVTYMVLARIELPWASSAVTLCSAVVLAYVTGHQAVDVRHGPEEEKPPVKKVEDQ